MRHSVVTVIIFTLLASGSYSCIASEPLRYNPFEQPEMLSGELSGSARKKDINGMKLRGTVIDGLDSLVNIDGEFYRLNQDVNGYRIVDINSASVTLRKAGNEMVLTLNNDDK